MCTWDIWIVWSSSCQQVSLYCWCKTKHPSALASECLSQCQYTQMQTISRPKMWPSIASYHAILMYVLKKKMLRCLQKWTSVTTELGMVWVRLTRFSRCLSTHSTITGKPIFSSEYDDCVLLALVPLPAYLLVLSCYFNFTPLAFVNQGDAEDVWWW